MEVEIYRGQQLLVEAVGIYLLVLLILVQVKVLYLVL